MTIKEHIAGEVELQRIVDGTLWYKTSTGLPFSVPPEDVRGATFLIRDRGILFMRWIKQALKAEAV